MLTSQVFPIYEPRIKGKADVLIEQLRRLSGNAVDSTAWSMFYSFDVMGEVGFGRDFDNLSTGKEHPGIQVMHSVIGFLGVLAPVPWLLNVLGSIPGASRTLIDFETIFQKVLAQKEAPSDVVSWILRATKDKDAPAVPTRRALTEDTRSVVIAGSDTTASTLANILFYLAEDTDCQRKVRRLLDGAMPEGYSSWDYAAVRKISYLDDIINETLRLKPAVITGVPRETPPQGLQIGKVWIPGHVNVVVPMLPIQRDPRWWEKPNEFIPERWSERSIEMGTRDAPWLPFNQGLHHCAGKDVALLTLRTAMAAIVQNFDITFAPQESKDSKRAFDRQFLSPVLMTPRPLHLIFTARDQEGQE
ncbi:hypothetical protein N0V91_010050 [Didymella pomorum]|uniref:Cytochrome P450 n=1 Tax=Didymella pomorum TaxID=749634 RepID=A0A9W8Z624_9PLEO|nr:hypothetical protein N0V91_010050 [Didymella pomorum]